MTARLGSGAGRTAGYACLFVDQRGLGGRLGGSRASRRSGRRPFSFDQHAGSVPKGVIAGSRRWNLRLGLFGLLDSTMKRRGVDQRRDPAGLAKHPRHQPSQHPVIAAFDVGAEALATIEGRLVSWRLRDGGGGFWSSSAPVRLGGRRPGVCPSPGPASVL